MPHDSLYLRLGRNKEERETRASELFAHIGEKGVRSGIDLCRDRWGITTSLGAISRFNSVMRPAAADAEMLDRLSIRAARAKTIGKEIKDKSPIISPEVMRALDQNIYELVF